jgi:hypothetical protein
VQIVILAERHMLPAIYTILCRGWWPDQLRN